MTWTLMPATPADHDILLPMVRAYHTFEHIELDDAARQEALARLLSETALGAIWLVRADGAIAGYVAVCIGFSIEFGGHDAFVDELWLEPPFRGRGGGRAVLTMLMPELVQRDIRALHLEVARDNDRARRLYRACGFEAREKYVLMSRAP